ncbi:hypothetical protein SUNI508_06981 [Seiridium unicorne]|uniref:Uncharacterized protein n=1 Tax=Seiridium unicorne TaxID=138068 RepID=A0ABR2UZ59_9PEZI
MELKSKTIIQFQRAGRCFRDRSEDSATAYRQKFDYKPSIFILPDILNEPDDSMSLVRYLLYSNEFDTRGICATTSWWLPNETHCTCVENQTVQNAWLAEDIRLGPLGSQYPQIIYTMEGDTPSFLWLVPNGLVYRDHIDWGTWGGRYNRPVAGDDWVEGGASNHFVNTHRDCHWRRRGDSGDASSINLAGPDPFFLKGTSKQTYTFSASLTCDPDSPADNGKLSFEWAMYSDTTEFLTDLDVQIEVIGELGGVLEVNDARFSNATLGQQIQIIAPELEGNPDTGLWTDFHLLLQVTNGAGKYPIRKYLRIVCESEV